MSITVSSNLYTLTNSDDKGCPSYFDPDTYTKTYDTYLDLMHKYGEIPVVEHIFDKVETYTVEKTKLEIKQRMVEENGDFLSESQLDEIATLAVEKVMDGFDDHIYNEVIEILKFLNLAYMSTSLKRSAYQGSVFNSPQVSMLGRRYSR